MPAAPQQNSASTSGTSFSPGIAASTFSGGALIRCACSRWHGASYVTVTSSGPPSTGPAAEKLAVLFHHCAAPGSVGYDQLRTAALERLDVSFRETASRREIASVRMQGAAARLICRVNAMVPVHPERARRGGICLAVQTTHDASLE